MHLKKTNKSKIKAANALFTPERTFNSNSGLNWDLKDVILLSPPSYVKKNKERSSECGGEYWMLALFAWNKYLSLLLLSLCEDTICVGDLFLAVPGHELCENFNQLHFHITQTILGWAHLTHGSLLPIKCARPAADKIQTFLEAHFLLFKTWNHQNLNNKPAGVIQLP